MMPPDRRLERIERFFTMAVRDAIRHRQAYLALDGASILGVALWEAPGTKTSAIHMIRAIPGYAAVFGNRLADAGRTQATMEAHRPRVPHWYLAILGVSPDARGRGAGSALLVDRHREIDSLRQPTYLESSVPENLPFYERNGYQALGEIPAVGTTPAIAMWRTARNPDQRVS